MALGNNLKRKKLIPDTEEALPLAKSEETQPVTAEPAPISGEAEKEPVQSDNSTDDVNRSIKISIQPSLRKSVKKVKVVVEGKLTIYNAQYWVDVIKPVISEYDIIDLKLENIEEMDLSAIQTLHYFRSFCNKLEKNTSFNADGLSLELKTMLVKTKYNKLLFKKPANTAA